MAHGAFAASKTVNDGNIWTIATSEIDVTFAASEVSNYLANIALDFAFRNQAFAVPDTFVAMLDAVAADDDTGSTISEPSGGSYAREEVDVNGGVSPTWDLATGTTPTYVQNTHAITFTTATASWSTIVAAAIVDAESAGNLLFYDNDMGDQIVGDGETAEFAIGVLDVQIT